MRIKWLVLSSLLFTACSKDDIPTPIPKWGPDIQTKTNTPPTKVTFNADNFTCGGFKLLDNIFQMNIGCRNTHGAIYLYCFDQTQLSDPSIVKYVRSVDS